MLYISFKPIIYKIHIRSVYLITCIHVYVFLSIPLYAHLHPGVLPLCSLACLSLLCYFSVPESPWGLDAAD